MDEWKWQQENVKLQNEIKRLRKEYAAFKVSLIPKGQKRTGGFFTGEELDFIRDNNLNHNRAYVLANRYDNVRDALIEVMEGIL
ncbi:hypothetical protein [Sporosarcina sp. FA9]|uniref:hypothetical protein n=1 Tax=Sporosarcina sp. FA9 TaxID=3413030 RepID=UPI003F659234